MAQRGFPTRFATARPRGRWVLLGLILVSTGVELALQGADHLLWGSVLWRPLAWQYGGFWAGLLRDWRPNYAAQPGVMFLTYALLHTGLGHLTGNMACLAVLGDRVRHRIGGGGLFWLYLVSALGGALGFGLLGPSAAPMIGASGAIFGLAGALTVWDIRQQRAGNRWTGNRWAGNRWAGNRWARAALILLALVGLNLVIWRTQAGNLAWQTHLGGLVAGAGFAAYPRRLAKTRS